MDGHEKIKMIGTEKPMDHNDWLRRIAADPSLDSLSRWQAGRILRETPPDKRSTEFYCPTKSFPLQDSKANHGFQNFPDHISIAQVLGRLEILLGRLRIAMEPNFRALQMNSLQYLILQIFWLHS